MNAMFNLWHPYLDDDGVFSFDATMANAPELGMLTQAWVQASCNRLGVSGAPEAWSVEPMRTQYFSDGLDESDWRDRWKVAWEVKIKPKTSFTWSNAYPPSFTPLAEADRSWDGTRRGMVTQERCTCVLMFSQRNVAKAKALACELLERPELGDRGDFVVHRYRDLDPPLGEGRMLALVRVRLPDCQFPQATEALDAAVEWCRRETARINWQA